MVRGGCGQVGCELFRAGHASCCFMCWLFYHVVLFQNKFDASSLLHVLHQGLSFFKSIKHHKKVSQHHQFSDVTATCFKADMQAHITQPTRAFTPGSQRSTCTYTPLGAMTRIRVKVPSSAHWIYSEVYLQRHIATFLCYCN